MPPESTRRLSRRRLLTIAGAAGVLPLAGAAAGVRPLAGAAGLLPLAGATAPATSPPVHWQGQVLGAEARITLYHPDPDRARDLIAGCLAVAQRLEAVFSLYRPDSALVRLNRAGQLADPPAELVELLRRAAGVSALSAGAFDATVQPLWTLYADHFAANPDDRDGPPAAAIAAARARVDWTAVAVTDRLIRFTRPGLAVTLNGIAHGYITDQATAYLRARGVDRVLVNLDDFRAVGHHPDGSPWRIGIADPTDSTRLLRRLTVTDRAVSSSGGYGTVFDRAGRFHHLFDTTTGRPAGYWAGTTVMAATATVSDALSTTLAVSPPDHADRILRDGGGDAALLVDHHGTVTTIGEAALLTDAG